MYMGDQQKYPTSFDECVNQLDTLHWKYDLPYDVETKLDDIIDQAQLEQNRDMTAQRVGWLIQYIYSEHPEYEQADQIRDYLNGVMTALYGNDEKALP